MVVAVVVDAYAYTLSIALQLRKFKGIQRMWFAATRHI